MWHMYIAPMHYSFDFDYTLADSSDGAIECANYALQSLGLPIQSSPAIKATIGLSLDRTFEELSGSQSRDQSADFKRYFLERADKVMLEHIHFLRCTGHVLESLKSEQHYISIVSTKFAIRIEHALQRDGLRGFVDAVIGGDDVKRNKPDPEGLLAAIEKSGLPRESTVYVGDSETDGECATRARVAFVGVLSGSTSRDRLARWSPRDIYSDISGLI